VKVPTAPINHAETIIAMAYTMYVVVLMLILAGFQSWDRNFDF
jgi:hypothetical protein